MPKTLDIANKDALPAPKRRNSLDPDRVISMIPIRPYHVVADIGCGPGYFSVPLAKYVNQGRLYAMDTKEKILDACHQRLSEVHLNNVEVLQCGPKKLPLDKDSVDGAFLAFVLNEVRDRNGLLTEAGRSMHKGGWLAILEWHKQATEEGPPLEDRISEEEAKELGQKAGLRYVSERDLNGQNYLILFRK